MAVSKTKFMIVSLKYYSAYEYVKTGIYNFEIVKDYTYLGAILTDKN